MPQKKCRKFQPAEQGPRTLQTTCRLAVAHSEFTFAKKQSRFSFKNVQKVSSLSAAVIARDLMAYLLFFFCVCLQISAPDEFFLFCTVEMYTLFFIISLYVVGGMLQRYQLPVAMDGVCSRCGELTSLLVSVNHCAHITHDELDQQVQVVRHSRARVRLVSLQWRICGASSYSDEYRSLFTNSWQQRKYNTYTHINTKKYNKQEKSKEKNKNAMCKCSWQNVIMCKNSTTA